MISLSRVKLRLVEPKDSLVAFASVVLNDSVCLNSIAIHTKLEGGYRLTYPKKGDAYLFYPLNKELSKMIESVLFQKYKDVIQKNDRYNCAFLT